MNHRSKGHKSTVGLRTNGGRNRDRQRYGPPGRKSARRSITVRTTDHQPGLRIRCAVYAAHAASRVQRHVTVTGFMPCGVRSRARVVCSACMSTRAMRRKPLRAAETSGACGNFRSVRKLPERAETSGTARKPLRAGATKPVSAPNDPRGGLAGTDAKAAPSALRSATFVNARERTLQPPQYISPGRRARRGGNASARAAGERRRAQTSAHGWLGERTSGTAGRAQA